MKGEIKWYSPDKKIGYIVDAEGQERFFGSKHVLGGHAPGSGDKVQFVPGVDRKNKPIARKVSIREQAYKGGDPREVCRHCNRKMTPRVITGPPAFATRHWTPEPKYSICPYCGGKHKFLKPKDEGADGFIGVIVVVAIVAIIIVGAIAAGDRDEGGPGSRESDIESPTEFRP